MIFGSVDIMLQTFGKFSKSTGLKVNPAKCYIYFDGVDQKTKEDIKKVTDFEEGTIPFRYLGIPLISKKFSIHNYMPLIDRIVSRLTHWSSRLLSYAGRIQLLKSVTFAIMNYWMQYLPFPKCVIHKIDVICRTFLWTGGIRAGKPSLLGKLSAALRIMVALN